jgi:hypothetical protein
MDLYGHWQLPLVLFEIALAVGVSYLVFGIIFPAPGSKRYVARQEATQKGKEVAVEKTAIIPTIYSPALETLEELQAAQAQAQSGPSLTYRSPTLADSWGRGVGSSLVLVDETDGVRKFSGPLIIGRGFITIKQAADLAGVDLDVLEEEVPKPRRVPDGTRDLDIDL